MLIALLACALPAQAGPADAETETGTRRPMEPNPREDSATGLSFSELVFEPRFDQNSPGPGLLFENPVDQPIPGQQPSVEGLSFSRLAEKSRASNGAAIPPLSFADPDQDALGNESQVQQLSFSNLVEESHQNSSAD
ncbi:MAG: hypothetical protein VCD34_06580, partial [Planctomycetota bacterium]